MLSKIAYIIYIIYICNQILNIGIMKTTALSPSKRKIINLDEETFKTLSIMAIEEGTNLKNYIEKVLSDIADNYQDSKLYAKLSKERPEGHIILNQQEKTDFENWLGVWM